MNEPSPNRPAAGDPRLRITELASHACSRCDGAVEIELELLEPEADVCLECLTPEELGALEDDLNRVREVNRGLMARLPRLEGWELAVHSRASRVLSGDFYDVVPTAAPDRLGILIGDVSGEGLPAALLRSALQGALRALVPEVGSPAAILEKANRQFQLSTTGRHFASVFCGLLDTSSGLLSYANAGQLPPLVRRAEGWLEPLVTTGPALGVLHGASYREAQAVLGAGDLLVLYSDGVAETGATTTGALDAAAFRERLARHQGGALGELASSIAAGLAELARPGRSDDQTLVLVRRAGAARPLPALGFA